jgi:hypothetical protein
MPSDVDVEGPDGKTYSFPEGTDKAAAIRYFKAKRIGSAASAIPPPTLAKPSVAMHPSYLIGDPDADATPQSMGEVAKGMARNVYQVSAPGIAASLAHKFAPGALSKSAIPHGESLERNATPLKELPGQIVENAAYAAIPEGSAEAEGEKAATPRGRTVPKPPAETLSPEQVEAVEKANRGYQDAKAQIGHREGLEQTSKKFVQQAHENLQQTYKAARGSLDQRWGQFRQGMEGAELDPAEAFNRIEAAKAKYLKGSPQSLTQFNNLAREMGIQEFMEGAGGELKAIPGSGQLPFDTARVHYSAIGDKLAQGGLPGNVYQALRSVEDGLDAQLTKAAESRKLGGAYKALKADEHQFRTDWVDPKSPLARAHKALDANFLEKPLTGPGNEYITKQLERYKQHGGKPELVGAAKHYAEQAKALGTKRLPEVKELPKAKPQRAGKAARAVGRVAGKVVGGTIGSKLGHPLVGYGIGGELGTEAAERLAARRGRVPPPPDE